MQAEDGIRDYKVTGVQTCALPICRPDRVPDRDERVDARADVPARGECVQVAAGHPHPPVLAVAGPADHGVPAEGRSEERRVGKEAEGTECEVTRGKTKTSVHRTDA